MKKVIAIVLCLTMVLTMFAGCGKKAESDVIKIGVYEPLTGDNGGGGIQELEGIKYANKMYPEVLGKKVELVIVDNKTDKAEAATAVTRLIEKDKVVAIIGTYGSAAAIAAGDIIKKNGIPAMGASCTNPMVTQGNEYYFRACYIDPFQGKVMANYALKTGAKTAAIIKQNGDDYSIGLANFFEKAFVELTGKQESIVSVSEFQANEQDFNAILTNIKAKNPDVIFAPSSIATAPLIIKQARALGITCPIMGGDTWENPSIIEVAGKDAEGMALSTFFDEDNPATEEAKKFIEGYKKELGDKEPIIPAVAACGYDAYIVMLDAIARAGSTDGAKIKDALNATKDFEGVTGKFSFDENGDAQKNLAIIKEVKNGQFVYVDTVEIK